MLKCFFVMNFAAVNIKPDRIMKILKTIIPAMALGAMLVSCGKSPVSIIKPEPGEIYFGSRGISVETKAVNETNAEALQSGGFRCAAVIDADKSEMFNAALSYADGFYKVPGKKYFFPAEGTVSFYAVYPDSEQICVAADGSATIVYSQNGTEDLVAASSPAHEKSDDAVMLTFSHKLSQLVVKCKGNDPETDFFVKGISITAPEGGVYDFTADSWKDLGGKQTYEAVPSEGETVGEDYSKSMTFIPGKVKIRFVWECRIKGTQTVVGEYDQSLTTELVKGRRSTMNVTLCNLEASELQFTASVDAWEGYEKDYDMQTAYLLMDAKKAAIAVIDSAMEGCTDPNALKEAEAARDNIMNAMSEEEIVTQKMLGILDIRYLRYPTNRWDISQIDFMTGGSINRTTANCYIVRGRGIFMIPAVYGNSTVNSNINEDSFKGPGFVDFEGNPITQYYIPKQVNLTDTQMKGELIWESNEGLLTNVSYYQGFVTFEVHDKQAKGNAVVALKRKSDDKVIWSWHLWFPGRDANMRLLDCNGEKMLNLNLGAISEEQDGSLYYQWGRKDPFPANLSKKTASGSTHIHDAILNPDTFFTLPEGVHRHWFTEGDYGSDELCLTLWNKSNTGLDTDIAVKKTIYDPCPSGYCVPRKKCFIGADMFKAAGYINSKGEYVQDASHGYYWIGVPGSSDYSAHCYGLMMDVDRNGNSSISSIDSSIGAIIRPMKMN